MAVVILYISEGLFRSFLCVDVVDLIVLNIFFYLGVSLNLMNVQVLRIGKLSLSNILLSVLCELLPDVIFVVSNNQRILELVKVSVVLCMEFEQFMVEEVYPLYSPLRIVLEKRYQQVFALLTDGIVWRKPQLVPTQVFDFDFQIPVIFGVERSFAKKHLIETDSNTPKIRFVCVAPFLRSQ